MGRHVVTGAYGYSGKYIAARLLERGGAVHTLTNSTERRNPFGDAVSASPLAFDDHAALVESLRDADALYNTYWVRFDHRDFSHTQAVENTRRLFAAARDAGVRRVVHVSITNPSAESPLPYFKGKAQLEQALIDSGMSYAILRPAVLFGQEDILVNNIAWALRRLPVFGVFGDGRYRIQPIYVDDLAELAVREGASTGDRIIDAIGPETFRFRELVESIGSIIGKRRRIVSVSPAVGYFVASAIGKLVGDVFLTKEEIAGLMGDLLCTDSKPTGRTALTAWAKQHAETLGTRYASELARRRNRTAAYEDL